MAEEVDDGINVANHRFGTKELESACLTVDGVADAANTEDIRRFRQAD